MLDVRVGSTLAIAVVASLVVAVPLSYLLAWLYSKGIARRMARRTSGERAWPEWLPGNGDDARPRLVVENAGTPSASASGLGSERRHAVGLVYVVAGLVYALIVPVVISKLGESFTLRQAVAFGLVMAWPAVPAFSEVVVGSRLVTFFGVGLLTLFPLTINPELLPTVLIMIGVPAAVGWAISNRRIRQIGPLTMALVLPSVLGILLGLDVLVRNPWTGVNVIIAAGCVLSGPLVTMLALGGLVAAFEHKWFSDQMLVIDVWWLVFTCWQFVLHGHRGPGTYLLFVAFAGYALTVRVGLRALKWRAADAAPEALLALRVFGHPKRSERFLDELGLHWRYQGPVHLVMGPDLASSYVEPGPFLAFVTGRLGRYFIATPDDVDRKLSQLDAAPDPDGRFRVNALFCTEDSWRVVVRGLAADSESVVTDARGFTSRNAGIRDELELLARLATSERVAIVFDDSTDRRLMRETIEGSTPGRPTRVLRAIPVQKRSSDRMRALLQALSNPSPELSL